MIDRPAIARFLQYSLVGGGTFLIDLLLLFLFIDVFSMHYLIATATAFVIAVSVNYVISRRLIFAATKRSHRAAYVNFLLIAGAGLGFVTGGMYVLVGVCGFPPIASRVAVAIVTGIWNYIMNLYVNFKVAGSQT